jgi:hypothetical protein
MFKTNVINILIREEVCEDHIAQSLVFCVVFGRPLFVRPTPCIFSDLSFYFFLSLCFTGVFMLMTFCEKNKTCEDISAGTQEAANREMSDNTTDKTKSIKQKDKQWSTKHYTEN